MGRMNVFKLQALCFSFITLWQDFLKIINASKDQASTVHFLTHHPSPHKHLLTPVNEIPTPNKDEDRGQDRHGKQDILNHPVSSSFSFAFSPSFLPGSPSTTCTHSQKY